MDPLTTILLLIGGGLIGFLLSVLGAGGSILLLPLLVSGVGLPTHEAVALALLVVLCLATINVLPCLRRRGIALRPAVSLGLPALWGSWIGGSWVKAGYIGESMELLVFAVAALLACWLLARPTRGDQALQPRSPLVMTSDRGPLIVLQIGQRMMLGLPGQGLLVGLLTGIAGVGGGFAIVPALVLLAGMSMPMAGCTSLLLIILNALVALAAQGHWPGDNIPMLLPLLLGGMTGGVIGQQLAPRLSERRLRQGFMALLLGSALMTASEAIRRQGHHPAGSNVKADALPRPPQSRPSAL